VISIFHETKIPTVDIKVQVYSKFRKNKIWKKVKSPISTRNGRFNTSRCKGKLQKMEVLYTHSPKSRGPFSTLPKNKKIKNWESRSQLGPALQLAGDSPATTRASFSVHCDLLEKKLQPSFWGTCGQLFLIGSSTCPPYPDFS
jgi:hypothetical protein